MLNFSYIYVFLPPMIRRLILAYFIVMFLPLHVISQTEGVTIKGVITNQEGVPIVGVNVHCMQEAVISSDNGAYHIHIPLTDTATIYYSHITYKEEKRAIRITSATTVLNVRMEQSSIYINPVEITYNKKVEEQVTYLSSDKTLKLVGLSLSGIEGSIKTLPGVSSKSELSSQYSVRGGSYDENLVFIEGVPIFKPSITSSDQHEGLSVINPYMVGSLDFATGGFGVQYGDKLSSVLNVNYKEVDKNSTKIDASFIDANITTQRKFDSTHFSYIIGARYKNTAFMLRPLDNQGEYKPEFIDFQALFRYKPSPKISLSYWLYAARNSFLFLPNERITDYGGMQQQFRLKVYFEGAEMYLNQAFSHALSLNYKPSLRTQLLFHAAGYLTSESEKLDVYGSYSLGELIKDTQSGENNSEDMRVFAVGSFLDHSRNYLLTKRLSIAHSGGHNAPFASFNWGVSALASAYNADYNEWIFVDSAGYALPYSDTRIELKNLKDAQIEHTQTIVASYVQVSKRIYMGVANKSLKIEAGMRNTFDTYSQSVLWNPRMRLLYKNSNSSPLTFFSSAGIYYQPVQFKELITERGEFLHSVQAQKSIQYALGYNYSLRIWNRPFMWQSELYYKHLAHIIPYTLQNVSIVYYPQLQAQGYTYGFETKLNGEFVNGVESWISLSFMQSKEFLKDIPDEIIRRPNDQFATISMFFQDFLPQSEFIKMNLTYLFGSSVPTAFPNARYDEFDNFSISAYSRVDLGLLVMLAHKAKSWLPAYIKNMNVGLEIFNLFENPNKISYFWVEAVNGRYFGVPNYLTPRRLNLKLSIEI